jgi:hypothetical protein
MKIDRAKSAIREFAKVRNPPLFVWFVWFVDNFWPEGRP